MENGSGQKNSVSLKSKQVPKEDKDKIKKLKEFIFVQKEDDALDIIRNLTNRSLDNYRDRSGVKGDEEGISILQYAAAYTFKLEVLEALVKKCPKLLQVRRTGDYNGLTVLHTLVSKGNVKAVRLVLDSLEPAARKSLLTTESDGSAFDGTVMMGELPLIIAALNFDHKMVDLLLTEYKAKVHHTNSAGDTVFHSLIRYAEYYPDKKEKALTMIKHFHHFLKYKIDVVDGDDLARQVWMVQNNAGFTALKLAAFFSQCEIFNYIFDLKGVYCHLGEHDGLFNHLLYDITEIDPAASRLLEEQMAKDREEKRKEKKNQVKPASESPSVKEAKPRATPENVRKSSKMHKNSYIRRKEIVYKGRTTLSVLEIVCETEKVEAVFDILNDYVIREVLSDQKWEKYLPWFWAWFAFHLVVMVCLTTYAMYKARVISYHVQSNDTSSCSLTERVILASEKEQRIEDQFTFGMSFVFAAFAVFMLFLEAVRVWKRQPLKLMLPHHNGLYRVLLLALSLSLIVDSVWYWVNESMALGPTNNYFLILALLAGWWFLLFFLRPLKTFSYFTVMLLRVLFEDMLRFSSVIVLQFVAFSVAMYITFLRSPGLPPEEFQNVARTALTMFKLMLGLEEMNILYCAHEPWLAILLFVLYVLLTYTLMLNALIALMSNTCSVVSKHKESYWLLQRLSVLLLIEASLPSCCIHTSGTLNVMTGKQRMFTEIKSVGSEDLSNKKEKKKASSAQKELMVSHAFLRTKDKSDPPPKEDPKEPPFGPTKYKDLLSLFGIADEAGPLEAKKKVKRKNGALAKSLDNYFSLRKAKAEFPPLRRARSMEFVRTPRDLTGRQLSETFSGQPGELELYDVNGASTLHATPDDVNREITGLLH